MDETKEMLKRQIDTDIQNLSTMEPGSDQKTKAVDDLVKLYGLMSGDEKLKNENKHRFIQYGITGLQILAPLAFYGVWMGLGFKFEEEGVFKSRVFQSMYNKFKPTH